MRNHLGRRWEEDRLLGNHSDFQELNSDGAGKLSDWDRWSQEEVN